ncbi:MAG TPA: hypothetical protein VM513_24815 [Kofleriaceae bacterium]|nr:hypothetical protein [Kofleriaceae bacterium]
MRRSAFVLVLVAACGGSAARGPAWPQMAERDEDGGESIAPRTASVIVETSSEKAEEEAKPAAEAPAAEAKPAAESDMPAEPALSAPVVAPEEVIDIDEIVIEIEDD